MGTVVALCNGQARQPGCTAGQPSQPAVWGTAIGSHVAPRASLRPLLVFSIIFQTLRSLYLLQERSDLHRLGLSKAKTTHQDWIRRAETMVRGQHRTSGEGGRDLGVAE